MPVLEAAAIVVEKSAEVAAVAAEKTVEVSGEALKEMASKGIETIKETGEAVSQKLDTIKTMSPEQLMNNMDKVLEQTRTYENINADDAPESKEGLTDEEKKKIKEETGWSDEIIDSISSMDEYQIYKDAGLVEAEINGRKCLIRSDIDWDQTDAFGRTNAERAEQGLSPINKDGKVIELHHIGQHSDSPLAELTPEEHRGKGNDGILHNKTVESEIDRTAFSNERSQHWNARAAEGA